MEKQFGMPLGDWQPPGMPQAAQMQGHYVQLERMTADHAHALYRTLGGQDGLWDYMAVGPFHAEAGFIRWVTEQAALSDPMFFVVIDPQTGQAGGLLSYMRIAPAMGVIEIGSIVIGPDLQRSRATTEAFLLMIGYAFENGYRRVEWKCDALNLPSRNAAQRLGLSYEGVFRQAIHYKGRNRDTAWFAAIDQDWPALREAYRAWLSPTNFDADGRQIERLSDLTRLVRVSHDPELVQDVV